MKAVIKTMDITALRFSFFLGFLAASVAMVPEYFVSDLVGNFLTGSFIFKAFLTSFFVAAIVEEGIKYFLFTAILQAKVNISKINEAVYFGLMLGLGFAIAENIYYIFRFGLSIIVIRSFTAIPLHASLGVFMSYWLFKATIQNQYQVRFKKIAYLVPVVLHGSYNWGLSLQALSPSVGWLILSLTALLTSVSYGLYYMFFSNRQLTH